MESPVDFFVWVSKIKMISNVYDHCEISVQLAICRQDHKWSKSEGCWRELMVYIYIYIYIYISWPTVVEGDPKATFSIGISPRCMGRPDSFPLITSLPFDPYLILLSVKQGSIKYHFREILVGRSCIDIYIYIYIYIASLATLISSDTTKQSVCGWQYTYIYIYIYIYIILYRIHISSSLKISNKNILKNILEI